MFNPCCSLPSLYNDCDQFLKLISRKISVCRYLRLIEVIAFQLNNSKKKYTGGKKNLVLLELKTPHDGSGSCEIKRRESFTISSTGFSDIPALHTAVPE